MDRTERFYRIDQLLHERRATPLAVMIEALGVSRATVKRDLEYMRDRLNAPITWDAALRGYRFDVSQPGAEKYALPGLWFNDQEVFALLTMYRLLDDLGSGLLSPHVAPLMARLNALLGSREDSAAEIRKRIRILHIGSRGERPEHFEAVASATIRRRRLHIRYHARSSDQLTERDVSPQRLVHYRDNWYLDAWCHLRRGLRSFSLDAIRAAAVLAERARPVAEKTLDEVLAGSYGIFSGRATRRARLLFTPERARWVAAESWHPQQRGRHRRDGSWELSFPYHHSAELVMDVLRHGAGVRVLGPAALREEVRAALQAALERYP